jgi:acyl-CoA synthetase (AMP-forming)/AMP-acid ligase II
MSKEMMNFLEFLGGSLFKEYLNDCVKTEQVLIRLPHLTGDEQLLYRIGDMAKYTEDGNLIVIGRLDFQFKIQDQRIEAAEVEHVIMAFSPSIISNCVVMKMVHEEQDCLIAYLAVGNNIDKVDVNDIRQYCQQHLASFSVPLLFVLLSSLPVLPNGKIDRNQVRKSFLVKRFSYRAFCDRREKSGESIQI